MLIIGRKFQYVNTNPKHSRPQDFPTIDNDLVYFLDFIRIGPPDNHGVTGMDMIFGRSIATISGTVSIDSNLWAILAVLSAIMGNWFCLAKVRYGCCLFLNACAGIICLMMMQIECASGYLQPLGIRMAVGYWIAFWAFGIIGMLDYLDSNRKTRAQAKQTDDKKLVINVITMTKDTENEKSTQIINENQHKINRP
jgi:hypothetical protein